KNAAMSNPFDPTRYSRQDITNYKADNERRVRQAALQGDVFVDGMPLKVTFELTADCNFFCRMCEFPSPREAGRKKGYQLDMGSPEFEMLAPQVFPHALMVNLTVVGEPLMVPYLDRVLELAGQWQTKIEFITHGQFLDQSMIERIGPHAAAIIVSFDGGTRHTFNRIRIGGDFNVITRNMMLFDRWRKGLPKGSYVPGFHINATLMRENIEELPTMIRLAKELGVDQFNAALMIAFSPKMAKSSLFHHKALANAAFRKARQVALELGVRAMIPAEFPGVSEEEQSAVVLREPVLPDGPLFHLKDWLQGGEVPDLKVEAAAPEEAFHEYGANVPEGGGAFVPLKEVGGDAQVQPEQVLVEMEALNKERAFGSPLQQSRDEKMVQAQAASALADTLHTGCASGEPVTLGVGIPAEPPREGARYTCKFLWNELFVSLSGDVAPCCIQGRPVVGNIHEQDLGSIWNGPAMREMRERLLEGNPIPCCRDCNYNTQLGQGTYREDTFIMDRTARAREL
ncbi:MAG TPA: SPASM domain-containing protein, partial [Planctomycetota bacterium]|nr:SPASM domain-containing protein [Planctomycetota bacterium]